MKIFDYNPIFGSFSSGFENFRDNEVTEVVNMSKNAEYAYNRIHKQWFLHDFTPLDEFSPQKDIDLAIFNPDFGKKVGRRGKSNFNLNDLEACLQFLKRENPDFAIFTTEPTVPELLNRSKYYTRDGFNHVSRDYLIRRLQKLGYDAYFYALDEAEYGIPIHRSFAFYIAVPKNHGLSIPKGLFNRSGLGGFSRFRSIADAIGDLGDVGEWVPYASSAQNVYQKRLRRGMRKITWHFNGRMLKDSQKETISKIGQGMNARTTKSVKQRSGYNRPKWHETPISMEDIFYLPSSKGPSIHPIHDRPFTFREGMRLHGLPDTLTFDLKTPYREVAAMVHSSIAPALGEIFAIALGVI